MTANSWPPKNYVTPIEYERNERIILVLSFALAILFLAILWPDINKGAAEFAQQWVSISASTGLVDYPILAFLGVVAVICAVMYVVWAKLTIPVHERLHYEVAKHFDLNPEYGTENGYFLSNPCVRALETGITVKQNITMLIVPFLIIGALSLAVLLFSSGWLAGLAAFVLAANSAASAQDLYHVGRLLRMPKQTQFANFEDGDDFRTEFTYPEQ